MTRAVAAASFALVLTSCLPACEDRPSMVVIDSAQAATILDADGRPTPEGCHTVCTAIDDDGGFSGGLDGHALGDLQGCRLASTGSMLEVVCIYRLCLL